MKIPVTFRPLLKPISFLLHDHRFLIAILTVFAFILSSNIPQLANQQQSVLTGLLALATLLIGGYSFDTLTASVKGAPTSLQAAEQQAITTGLGDIINYASATGTLTATPIAVPTTSATATASTAASSTTFKPGDVVSIVVNDTRPGTPPAGTLGIVSNTVHVDVPGYGADLAYGPEHLQPATPSATPTDTADTATAEAKG